MAEFPIVDLTETPPKPGVRAWVNSLSTGGYLILVAQVFVVAAIAATLIGFIFG